MLNIAELSAGTELVSQEHEDEEMSPEIAKLLQEKARLPASQDENDSVNFDIWDFAGQELYYTTHQVYLKRVVQFCG